MMNLEPAMQGAIVAYIIGHQDDDRPPTVDAVIGIMSQRVREGEMPAPNWKAVIRFAEKLMGEGRPNGKRQ